MDQINVAIIGQGRSGRGIHGHFFRSPENDIVKVVAVAELDELRRERALADFPGCAVTADYRDFFARGDIDIVVNATFSKDHYGITKDLLLHGMNVIVEKPFARNRFECDELIRIAEEKGLLLAVFQQSFLATFYEETKKVIASGVLGDILQIDITYSGFARRWDWQTTQKMMGGGIYNTGPHPIGVALGLLDFDERARVAFSRLGKTALSSGDADDYAKIILTAPGKPVVDIEVNSNDAYAPGQIKLLGTKGTYRCTIDNYEMKYIVEGENVERPVVLDTLRDENGRYTYCSEELKAHTEQGEYVGNPFAKGTSSFYRMVYDRLKTGKPMQVTPKQAAMIVSVIEAVHAENPMPLKF